MPKYISDYENFRKSKRKSLQNINWKLLLCLVILIGLTIFKLHIYYLQKTIMFQMNDVADYVPQRTSSKENNLKYIQFWTNFYDSDYWGMGAKVQGDEYLKSVNCPVTNCIFSHDRNLLPSSADYDALVFHVGEAFSIFDLPTERNENQIYIMASNESPIYTKHNLIYDKNFYNMTFTYRIDSDIYWGYSQVIDIDTDAIVAPARNIKWRKPEVVDDPNLIQLIKSKSKMAAWFVSHCGAFSNRNKLTEKLQQFINVDVYGACGNLTCPRSSNDRCHEMLNSTYKFYLAFENSLCVDYITEKVFETMKNYIIPVVFNGIDNMLDFLPPHSYISVNDFSNVEELAKYLQYLAKNPQEYANYFWWKKYYKLDNRNRFCDMCYKLNEWDIKGKRQQYFDIGHWWNYRTCQDRRDVF